MGNTDKCTGVAVLGGGIRRFIHEIFSTSIKHKSVTNYYKLFPMNKG